MSESLKVTPFDVKITPPMRIGLPYFSLLLDPFTARAMQISGFGGTRYRNVFICIRVVCLPIMFLLCVLNVYQFFAVAAVVVYIAPLCVFRTLAQVRQAKLLSEIPMLLNLVDSSSQLQAGLQSLGMSRYEELLEFCPTLSREFKSIRRATNAKCLDVAATLSLIGDERSIPELVSLGREMSSTDVGNTALEGLVKNQTKEIYKYWMHVRKRQFRVWPGKLIMFFTIFVLPLALAIMLGSLILSALTPTY